MTTIAKADPDTQDLKEALAAIDRLLFRNQSLNLALISDARQAMIDALAANEEEAHDVAGVWAAEVYRVAEEARCPRRNAFFEVMDRNLCDEVTRDAVAKCLGITDRERSCGWDD